MNTNHKITIPEPCHEKWDKMTPKDNGRFCLSCTKTVVDFTKMLPEEIQHYFISNQNKSICGRFKNTQLDEIIIQIPSRVLYSQTHYRKMFLLALFIAMGTTLFSCQDKNGNKQKIDKVEVVKEVSNKDAMSIGKSLINDTTLAPPPPKTDQIKFVKPAESCTDPSNTKKIKKNKNNASKETIYVTGEVASQTNAEFPGGIEQFYNFFGNEFKNPEKIENTDKKFKIAFAVEKDGSLNYLKSENPINEEVEKEIIRVLKLCPKWQPGTLDGKKTKMQYSLPIVLQ